MREFFTIAIFKIKADIRMNKTTLNSQKEKHSILSLRRATQTCQIWAAPAQNFYPRSPCGERHTFCGRLLCAALFLSTLSLRRATSVRSVKVRCNHISIHALLAESDTKPLTISGIPKFISIHALLAESDDHTKTITPLNQDFYPRSPCGERLRQSRSSRGLRDFYPRSPCGERLSNNSRQYLRPHFYPRSPCGERP